MSKGRTRLQAELDRRASILQGMDAGGCDLCQDDYEWATMSGEYADERASYQGYETAEERGVTESVMESLTAEWPSAFEEEECE